MKKVISIFLALMLILPTVIYAQDTNKYPVYVNGEEVTFTEYTGMPYMSKENRLMVPLGLCLTQLGVELSFDNKNLTLTAINGENKVVIPVGTKYIEVEGKKFVLDSRTRLIDGRTYGPIAQIVIALRMKAGWDAEKNAVILSDEPTYELLNLVDTVSAEDAKVELVEKKDYKPEDYTKLLGSYSTKFSTSNASRATNIKIATQTLNGKILKPGEEFSFNGTLGSRTADKGYLEGTAIVGGEYVKSMGGGVCQVSSTLFNAALESNMTITARRAHSQKQAYIPGGRDATVYYGQIDLKFKNPYEYPVMIKSSYTPGQTSFSIYGVEEIEKPNVQINVTQNSSGVYTLTRTANGVKNYTTNSKYAK